MPTARLGIAFSHAGAQIDAICPARHVIRKAAELRNAYTYKALSPLESLRAAISSSQPDLIVSADDLTTQHLIDLHALEKTNGNSGSVICELIERSIGPHGSFSFMTARARFMELANEEGVRIPKTGAIRDLADLEAWAAESGFPIVLKADGSSSGEGTKIVQSLPQAEHALKSLQEPVELIRVVKRAVVNRDLRSVRAKLQHRRAAVTAANKAPGRSRSLPRVMCPTWVARGLNSIMYGNPVCSSSKKSNPCNPESFSLPTILATNHSISGFSIRRMTLAGPNLYCFSTTSK